MNIGELMPIDVRGNALRRMGMRRGEKHATCKMQHHVSVHAISECTIKKKDISNTRMLIMSDFLCVQHR